MSFSRERFVFKKRPHLWPVFLLLLVLIFGQFTGDQVGKSSKQYVLTPARQYQLFQKILAFERSWKKKNLTELNLAILYEKNYELSCWIKDEFIAAVKTDAQIVDLPVQLTEMAIEEVDNWAPLLSKEKIFFLYITPLRPAAQKTQLKKILTLCNNFKVATFTGETDYVDLGVAIGLGVADQNPQVIINLQAARTQGLELSSQLLRMSSIK